MPAMSMLQRVLVVHVKQLSIHWCGPCPHQDLKSENRYHNTKKKSEEDSRGKLTCGGTTA